MVGHIESPHVRSTLVMSGPTVAAGIQQAKRARDWMEGHEGEFKAIAIHLAALNRASKRGYMRDRVKIWCADHGVRVEGDGFRFANALWAPLSRYLALYDPSLHDMLGMHDSAIDCVGLLPVSWHDFGEAA